MLDSNMKAIDIKAFVPAKDFALSQQFYKDIGFNQKSEGSGVAFLSLGSCNFLLQDFYQQQLAENFMMHLQVADAQQWHLHISQLNLAKYGTILSELVEQPWAMLDFVFNDPSGVLWRVGQNI